LVRRQPSGDLVDIAVIGSPGRSGRVERGPRHGRNGGPILGVVTGAEQIRDDVRNHVVPGRLTIVGQDA
jgi:hypothetical protein